MSQTTVVVLDLPEEMESKDDRFQLFTTHQHKNADAQLDHLKNKILKVMDAMAHREDYDAKDQIFIVWREHGLTDYPNTHVTNEFRKNFKRELSDLTKKHSNLTLFSGSLLTVKQIKPIDDKKTFSNRTKFITESFQKNKWIIEVEKHTYPNSMEQHQYQKHLNQATDLINHVEAEISSRIIPAPINQIRNTCYIFNKGHCVARHDKIAPWSESDELDRSFFQPSNYKNNSSIVTVDETSVAVSICRENLFPILQHELSTELQTKPKIHFLFSNTIEFIGSHVYGDYFIQVDSDNNVEFICTKPENEIPLIPEVVVFETDYWDLDDGLNTISYELIQFEDDFVTNDKPSSQQQSAFSPVASVTSTPSFFGTNQEGLDKINRKRMVQDANSTGDSEIKRSKASLNMFKNAKCLQI